MSHSSKTMEEYEKALRTKMREMLELCTEQENHIFSCMYDPKKRFEHPVNGIPFERLDWAFSQIERTLDKKKTK